jgi:hypothetical protein
VGTTNFVNDVGGGDAIHAEVNSTDAVAALSASQLATSGGGSALNVSSQNSAAPMIVGTGAGDLINLKNAAGATQFKVSNTGAVTTGGPQLPTVVTLADAATVAVNAALGSDFRLTIAGNRTLANPTNPTDGQKITFQITQGSGAPWTLTYGTAYEFSSSLPQPTLSGAAGRTDLLGFIYNAAKGTWLLAAFVNGFA